MDLSVIGDGRWCNSYIHATTWSTRVNRDEDDAPTDRVASAGLAQNFGALLGREQPAKGRDLAHLDRVPVKTGQDAM